MKALGFKKACFDPKTITMNRVIITYGLIAGAIVSALMFITIPLWRNDIIAPDKGELVGYTTMVIALSMVFFGVKSYRDNHQNGTITFWKGVKAGLLITLIASLMYGLSWEVCYRTVMKDFTTQMTEQSLAKLKKEGATEAAIKKAMDEMADFVEKYQNPFIRFGITLTEILPVGIIISFLSAALLKRRQFMPATE